MIVDPPSDTPAPLATALNLTCNATGNPPPTYSWYRDSRLIPGAVLPYLYIAEATPENRGYYRCEVMNNINSTQSTPGLVTIPGTLSIMTVCAVVFSFIHGQKDVARYVFMSQCDNFKNKLCSFIRFMYPISKMSQGSYHSGYYDGSFKHQGKVKCLQTCSQCPAGVYQYSIEVELNNQSIIEIDDLPNEVR